MRGQLLLDAPQNDAAQAFDCFDRALSIARRRGARLWELRAAVSMARLWRGQGKDAEAAQLLVPIYERFTEGFDTVDLVEARELLTDLGYVPTRSPSL
jgi:predicted ATPase